MQSPLAAITRGLSLAALVSLAAPLGFAGCSMGWSQPDGPYLTRYKASFYRDLGERFLPAVSRERFAAMLKSRRVLFLGDHHRDPSLHNRMLELLDWIVEQGYRPVLGLECVGIEDNPSLQAFLSGGISMEQFRRRVSHRWQGSWFDNPIDFDTTFFRTLLRRAKGHRLDAFPLEPTPRLALSRRDTVIANNIHRALRLYPDRLIVVVVGHAHLLGEGHLVGKVGEPCISIAARLSPSLEKALVKHPNLKADGFLRSEREVLFFPPPAIVEAEQ